MAKSPEEELIRLLKFGGIRRIRDFINNNPSMDLHYPGPNLQTPLMTAIDRSDPALLTILMDRIPVNLDASLTHPCGRTALMYAAFRAPKPEILQILIKKGADPNKSEINGWNSLYYAVIGRRLMNVICLLDCNVSIHSQDNEGRTPLMISIYLSSLAVFEYLLKRGADVGILDNNGLNALHLAILWKKRDCVIELSRRYEDIDLVLPISGVSTQQLKEKLMHDVLPVEESSYSSEEEFDEDR